MERKGFASTPAVSTSTATRNALKPPKERKMKWEPPMEPIGITKGEMPLSPGDVTKVPRLLYRVGEFSDNLLKAIRRVLAVKDIKGFTLEKGSGTLISDGGSLRELAEGVGKLVGREADDVEGVLQRVPSRTLAEDAQTAHRGAVAKSYLTNRNGYDTSVFPEGSGTLPITQRVMGTGRTLALKSSRSNMNYSLSSPEGRAAFAKELKRPLSSEDEELLESAWSTYFDQIKRTATGAGRHKGSIAELRGAKWPESLRPKVSALLKKLLAETPKEP